MQARIEELEKFKERAMIRGAAGKEDAAAQTIADFEDRGAQTDLQRDDLQKESMMDKLQKNVVMQVLKNMGITTEA